MTNVDPKDQFKWWRAALEANEKGMISNFLQASESHIAGQIMPGFYRTPAKKGGLMVAVAFWYPENSAALQCAIDGKPFPIDQRLIDRFSYIAKNPVRRDKYGEYIRTKKWWDQDDTVHDQQQAAANESAGLVGHNKPDTEENPLDLLRREIDIAREGVKKYEKITTDDELARAQTLRSLLLTHKGKADGLREDEKRPHLRAGRAVDEKWQPLVKDAEEAAKAIVAAMNAYSTQKRNEALAAAEDQRKRDVAKLAETAAAAGVPADDMPQPRPVAVPPPARAKGATGRGASGSIKSVAVLTSDNQDAVYAAFRTDPDMLALLQRLAQRAIDTHYKIEGLTSKEEVQYK